MLRKKDTPSQPCYTAPGRGNATFSDKSTLTPAATRSGWKAHTVPPL